MSISQAIMSPPQVLPENLLYSTVLDVLDHLRPLPSQRKNEIKASQSITHITHELKQILLSYLDLDLTKTATYFEDEISLFATDKFTAKQKESLSHYHLPDNIDIAFLKRGRFNYHNISLEEQKKLARHIDRKIVTYLLIRINIKNIQTVYELITFKQLLTMIKESGSKLGGRGLTFSNKMGETISHLISYVNKMGCSQINSQTMQNVMNSSEHATLDYLKNKIQSLIYSSPESDIDMDDETQVEKNEIVKTIHKATEKLDARLKYFISLEYDFNYARLIDINKPVIAKFHVGNINSRCLNDLIKHVLADIYTGSSTKDYLIPIIEGYNRNTQMAFLLSIASLIGSGINFFTNPNLINLTLSYLMEGILTSDVVSNKEVLKISSLSIFSSASHATTLAIEEPLKKSLTSNGPSL